MASDESSDIFDRLDRRNTNDYLSDNKKSSWKHRLKGKLFTHKHSSEDPPSANDPVTSTKVNASRQDDLQDFFHPHGRAGSPPLPKKALAPKLSVATSLGQDGANEIFLYHKPRRREGLHVEFTEAQAEVIGRGGDETLDPVVSISRLLKQTQFDGGTRLPLTAAHHFLPEPEEESISMRPFKRTPTGFPTTAGTIPDARKLSAESASLLGSSTDSLQRHSPAGPSEAMHFSPRRSAPQAQTMPSLQDTTPSSYGSTIGQVSEPQAHSELYRRDLDDRRAPRNPLPQPRNDGAHLALPSSRAQHGASPSPMRRAMPPNRDSNENERPTSQSSHEDNHTTYQTLSPMSLMDPAASSLSLSSRLSDRDAHSHQPQIATSRKEYSPYSATSDVTQVPVTTQEASSSRNPLSSIGDPAPGTGDNSFPDMTTSKEAAYQELVRRISHTRQIFELISQRDTANSKPSPGSILRAAIYWFIVGRLGLEEYVRDFRAQTGDDANQTEDSSYAIHRILQSHVNLAKTWWLSTQIGAEHERGENPGQDSKLIDSGTQQGVAFLTSHFQNLAKSMAKRNLLPPEDLLVKGAETSLWLRYPSFPSQIGWILQNSASGQAADGSGSTIHPLVALPLGHTQTTSCLHSFPVECRVFSAAEEEGALPYDANLSEGTFTCLAFVLRKSEDREISVRVSSLSRQVNILIREDNQFGPSWEHVRWNEHEFALRVKLPNRFRVSVKFRQQDFQRLEDQYQMRQTTSDVVNSQDASRLAVLPKQTTPLQVVSQSIPSNRSADAPIDSRVDFESSHESLSRTSGLASPQTQSQLEVRAEVRMYKVEYFSADAQPANRTELFRIEKPVVEILQSDEIASPTDNEGESAYLKLQAYGFAFLEQIYSREITCSFYLGPETEPDTFGIQLLRPSFLTFEAQKEPSTKADRVFVKLLQDFQETVKRASVISRWTFSSLDDLHDFQLFAFGTHVQFDGVAKTFSMSRRLPMVPVSKTYESNDVRIQIAQYHRATQLLCFFGKYSLANVLQFPLRSSDNIELFGHKGKEFGVKMVDAKFDLPSDDIRKRVEGSFINMESEHPIDHEDITIEFETETERDRFAAALPAQATASKKFSLRRRI